MYYGILLMIEKLILLKKLEKMPAVFTHIYTMFFVIGGWVIFAIEDMGRLLKYFLAMFGINGAEVVSTEVLYYLRDYSLVFVILIIASTPIGKIIYNKMNDKVKNVVVPVLIAVALVICTGYLVDSTYNPFLYFRF
jgi:alginate O-acetyltransferase complex protein AlgI